MTASSTVLPADCDPRVRQLFDYWLSIHPAGGGLPGRQHFDPLAVAKLLPWLWMADVQRSPLRFRYRLLGTENVREMERDYTGRWIDEANPGFLASPIYPQFVAAVERGQVAYRNGPPHHHVRSDYVAMKDYITIERVLLPMARDGRVVDLLLAISIYHHFATEP